MSSTVKAYLGVLLTVAIWGTNVVVIKVLLQELPQQAINVVRFSVGSLILLGLMYKYYGIPKLTLKDALGLFVVGALGNFLFHTFFLIAIKNLPVSLASLVNSVAPLLVALLSPLFGLRLGVYQYVGVSVSLLGMVLLSLAGTTGSLQVGWLGVFGFAMASLVWALYTIYSRVFSHKFPALTFVALSLALSSLPYVLFFAPLTLQQHPQWWAWLGSALVGVFANVVAYLTWANGINTLGAAKTSVFQNLSPVIAVVLGVVFLHEHLPAVVGASIVLILAGVLLTNYSPRSS